MNFKKKLRHHRVFILLVLLVGCSTSIKNPTSVIPTEPSLRFVNHSRPMVNIDFDVFDNIGCPPNEYGYRKCKEDSILFTFGCDVIREPSNLLGLLKPVYPIILCETKFNHIVEAYKDIDEAYKNSCEKSSVEICSEINKITEGRCFSPFSDVCAKYLKVLEKKCIQSPKNICEPLLQFEIMEEVLEEYFIDHIALGNYTYSSEGGYFFSDGGITSVLYRYVIFKDGQFILIETEEEFREIFAPIETKEEALGYVKAVTGLFEYYGLESDSNLKYFVDVIEDTHVKIVDDGYLVYLYFKQVFGCGPHHTYTVEFYISPQGRIQQLGSEKVFKNPNEDGMCTD